jgi:hypothetical protein
MVVVVVNGGTIIACIIGTAAAITAITAIVGTIGFISGGT